MFISARSTAVLAALIAAVIACPAAGAAETAARDGHARPKAVQKKTAKAPADQLFGREGDPRKVKRTIRVDTSDTMRFFPHEIRVKRGDTVRFDVRNRGQLTHEMVLGTMDELKKQAERMRRDGAEMSNAEPHVAHVEPGETGRIVWQFTKPGEFYYACLMPGHFQAGMIGTIVVR